MKTNEIAGLILANFCRFSLESPGQFSQLSPDFSQV